MTLDILFFAAIALFLGWRLYSVLGQRIGHEGTDKNKAGPSVPPKSLSNGKTFPAPSPRNNAVRIAEGAQAGLDAIAAADPSFQAGDFMEGARIAREMILEAFSQGRLDNLKPLLTSPLYREFEQAIEKRRSQNQRLEYHFIGIHKSEIGQAELNNGMASIDVHFETEHSQALFDREGHILEGDLKFVDRVSDIWTFTRDVKSKDPNWQLAAIHETDE